MGDKAGKKDSTVIEAAGGLVWRQTPQGAQIAVIHRPAYDDWTLPKGKLKRGESWEAAAMREVREETGCEVILGHFAGSTSYQLGGAPKVVLYWHMQLNGACHFIPNEEVDELRWLAVTAARALLSNAGERALLAPFLNDSLESHA